MNKSIAFTAFILPSFLTLVLITCFSIAKAQEEGPQLYEEQPRLFYAGLIGGVNLGQVDGDNYAGYHKVGANFGGIGYVQLAKHVAISWEILYTQRGAKSNQYQYSPLDSFQLIKKYVTTLSYAEVPVMINYFDKRKSHAGIGVSFARLVSSSETQITNPASTIDFNKYPFEKNALDIVAGAQMHLWKGLFFNVRFQYSLIPIRTALPPGFSRPTATKEYNNLWTIRLMYLLI